MRNLNRNKGLSHSISDLKESLTDAMSKLSEEIGSSITELKAPLDKLRPLRPSLPTFHDLENSVQKAAFEITATINDLRKINDELLRTVDSLKEAPQNAESKIKSDWDYYRRLLRKEGFISGVSVEPITQAMMH